VLELFRYNWQIRDDWFEWCTQLPLEELLKTRVGGMGSILHTIFHVIDGEQIWLYPLMKIPVIEKDIDSLRSLEEVKEFSDLTRRTILPFLSDWNEDMDYQALEIKKKNGDVITFTYKKVIQHIICHEIHHIGQLSIWSRELGIKPVNSDLIIRNF
jgi:uncharacterized damage-inducible protein DinB